MRKVMLMSISIGTALLFCAGTWAGSETESRDEKARVENPERAADSAAKRTPAPAAADNCDAACQREETLRARLEEELKNIPSGSCKASYFDMNPTSKVLAEEAVQECRRNYAMQRVDPDYVPKTAARERSVAFNRELSWKAEQAVKVFSLLWLSRQQR